MQHRYYNRILFRLLIGILWTVSSIRPSLAGDQKLAQEEGEFRIFASGQELGVEKYTILSSADAASSTSSVEFRSPTDRRQKIHLETKLAMNGHYLPKSYQLMSDVDSHKGTIKATFSPQQAIFDYLGGPRPRREGLLVGDHYTILDTNIFHHFIFLVRLFDYDSKAGVQRFEVVIPQEQDNGVLKISEVGKEKIEIKGKKIDTFHLEADSGALRINLWVDGHKTLQKITVPDRGIEVLRKP